MNQAVVTPPNSAAHTVHAVLPPGPYTPKDFPVIARSAAGETARAGQGTEGINTPPTGDRPAVATAVLALHAGEPVLSSAAAKSGTEAAGSTTCVMPAAIHFKGKAAFQSDVLIEGSVEGQVSANGGHKISVLRSAEVKGDVTAESVHVDGIVDGKVNAQGGLASFGPNSTCFGEIAYTRLAIEDGAVVEASMKRISAAA
jgi:cytoskeletal protein CcmA (bactofilin family)